jgi:hypothetical protein
MSDNFAARLNQILPRLISPELRTNSGLGNEIGFYVFNYPPERELDVRRHVQLLRAQIARQHSELRVSEVNLFDLLVDYLRRRKILDPALKLQREKGDAELQRALKGSLHEEKVAQEFIAAAKPNEHDMVFMTGVGNVWPLLRTHTLLNNLHALMQAKPLIVFYPGMYDGQTLKLFGRSNDQNYYRAFRLVA